MADVLSGRRRRENRQAALRLTAVLGLVLLAGATFLVIDAFDPLLVLPYRLPSLGALVCVGWASGVSTVMFQTVTGNRILTPSVLGLDALYALLQTVLLVVLGAAGFSALPDLVAFGLTLLVMIGVSVALMGAVLGARRSVTTLVLLGIVLGTFLRSGTTFIQRLLAPNDFLILQDRLFASFGSVNPDLLVLSLVLTAVVSLLAIRDLRVLDVVALGPDIATALGVDHRRVCRRLIVMVAVLVSVSTALVGPIMFLGLLVAHLAYRASGTNRHVITVPMSALMAMLVLVVGQTVLAHVLDADNVLSVIIEFLGGLTLIVLIISSRRRS
ncbi:iron chelate uptake ABC transporter family permease subunit [Actinomyces sp. ZJ308]|uniref:iron chelate uptake ABC transporter family permease subunit n=1 Tax=Actinomyces sp. ZJ308 TaxID=2708342 RepID=UPI0014204D72|nr:iron chelate uptake ABC transporter family permease subunit [Actinomyces sp. ZJ308]